MQQVRNSQFEEDLNKRLELAENDKKTAVELAEANIKNEFQGKLAERDKAMEALKAQNTILMQDELLKKEKEIMEMQSVIENAETSKKLAIAEALREIEKLVSSRSSENSKENKDLILGERTGILEDNININGSQVFFQVILCCLFKSKYGHLGKIFLPKLILLTPLLCQSGMNNKESIVHFQK